MELTPDDAKEAKNLKLDREKSTSIILLKKQQQDDSKWHLLSL